MIVPRNIGKTNGISAKFREKLIFVNDNKHLKSPQNDESLNFHKIQPVKIQCRPLFSDSESTILRGKKNAMKYLGGDAFELNLKSEKRATIVTGFQFSELLVFLWNRETSIASQKKTRGSQPSG